MTDIAPRTYATLKPLFLAALTSRTEPGASYNRQQGAILAHLKASDYTSDDIEALGPYIHAFMEEVVSGAVNPFPNGPFFDGFQPEPKPAFVAFQKDIFGPSSSGVASGERALIEQLIAATRLYDSSEAVEELFAFTVRLREFAPFNAMLLHIQKPGLTHVATAQDWWARFKRVPKKGARPLLILRTKGPVDFVFDVLDTEGRELPVDAFAFPTFGDLAEQRFGAFMLSVKREKINILPLDAGDATAGWIKRIAMSKTPKGKNLYQLAYNQNHSAATRFVTVAHELAHLYLGHLGDDRGRRVPNRRDIPNALREVEAEMAAYLVAMRNGVKPRSESYLANYKGAFDALNLYAVTRAANAVETALGISAQKLWNEKA
ncbi:MAG: ImmA/IrrE family metallo-endopeptidase [Beijerinckiaceae bacterium]|nr:ImmA/IrrE family metallo-endopeptidase [Beijerinckiaceae bacterium]